MKKAVYLIIIFLAITVTVFKTNYERIPFKIKYAPEMLYARYLLDDDYSKKVFDTAIEYYNDKEADSEHAYAPFTEYEHPSIKNINGYTVLDLGVSADVEFTEILLNESGENGKVIGVEANPNITDTINKKLKNYPNFKLYNYAIWSKDGKAAFGLGDNPESEINLDARLISEPEDNFKKQNTVEVETVTIDNLIKNKDIGKVDYIKADIEGAELPALKGAEKTIKKYKPDLYISCHRNYDFFKIILKINSIAPGYKFNLIEYYHEYDPAFPLTKYWRNYVIYASYPLSHPSALQPEK